MSYFLLYPNGQNKPPQSLLRWSSFRPTLLLLGMFAGVKSFSPERGYPGSMFYSSCLSLGLACFGFCSSRRQHVRVFGWYFGVTVFTSSALLFFSFSLQWCVCLSLSLSVCALHVFVWVFHPWGDEKSGTICYAAMGHNRQHHCRVQ